LSSRLFLQSRCARRHLHSFPTRRSSDLYRRRTLLQWGSTGSAVVALQEDLIALGYDLGAAGADGIFGDATYYAVLEFQQTHGIRSEEHTSELQSREKLVCRLLLEKKNRK